MEHDDETRPPGTTESAPEAISARFAGVAYELAETAARLRRAVDEGTAPSGTVALVARLEDVVSRMRRTGQETASESEHPGEET
jgi:hypothetical protein